MYLFGYGSLINIISAQKSFKRQLTQDDLIPVTIKGYEKVWNSIEFIQFDGIDVNGIFLNLKENPLSQTNGVVVKITEEELVLLKQREKNYSCITIDSSNVLDKNLDDDIIAFMTTKEDKLAKAGDENCFIPKKYIEILTNSFDVYSDDFVSSYKKCLDDLPFALKDGVYKFSDPLQNKLAKQGVKE